ncbi:MAG: hypothetical protein AAB573_03860 [Patescibacteria group bacterium]
MEVHVKALDKARSRSITSGAAKPVVDVNWYKRGTKKWHVISPVDERPKSSHNYYDCVGVAAIGVDKKTKKNISILTHQEPRTTTIPESRYFANELSNSLQSLKERSVPGSVRVSLFGGQRGAKGDSSIMHLQSTREYSALKEQARAVVLDVLGIEPKIAVEPRMPLDGPNHVVLDTKRARLRILQENGNN